MPPHHAPPYREFSRSVCIRDTIFRAASSLIKARLQIGSVAGTVVGGLLTIWHVG